MTSHGFNPEMLALARKSRGLTQVELAIGAGVDRSALARYESGDRSVPVDALAKLSAALEYPIGFFERNPQLLGVGGGAIFHRKRQSMRIRALYHAHACAEIRRLEIATMLHSLGDDPPILPEYPVEFFDDDPAKIARTVRAEMNIPPGPVFNLTQTLERNGCIVVGHDFESRYLDGFSQRAKYPPSYIHMNNALPPDRWRWTLAHELGHLVMHFDLMESPRVAEEQANKFAAEFLTPAHEIGSQLANLTFQKLSGLKMQWMVSIQALITRAHQLSAITPRQYQSMFTQLSKAGYRTREPAALDPPKEPPRKMVELARRHYDELHYKPQELASLLMINDVELIRYYTDDIWQDINEIVENF